ELARARPGVGALKPIEADDVELGVFLRDADRAGGGDALALDLDDVAVGEAERGHDLLRQTRKSATAVARRQARDLKLDGLGLLDGVGVSHSCSSTQLIF